MVADVYSAAKMAAPVVAQTAKRSFSAVQQVIELSNYLEQRISATAAETSSAEYAETGKVSVWECASVAVLGCRRRQRG